ncbi:hypothetical protein Taro_040651 [Colocasia esculenta]|uniref:Uncharacterized protein n=1 Tax=Colocasia esculenta TaxID=4460 RepID=A0A843WJB8_COLES|nr:hypothetical protein [Colocasia esculenta]
MGYKLVDGRVTRTLKGQEQQAKDESSGNEDNDDDSEPDLMEVQSEPAADILDAPAPPADTPDLRTYLTTHFAGIHARLDQLTEHVDTQMDALADSHVQLQHRLTRLYIKFRESRHPNTPRCGVVWSPQLVGTIEVERQLDLLSVAARLRGSSVWFVQGSFRGAPVAFSGFLVAGLVRGPHEVGVRSVDAPAMWWLSHSMVSSSWFSNKLGSRVASLERWGSGEWLGEIVVFLNLALHQPRNLQRVLSIQR